MSFAIHLGFRSLFLHASIRHHAPTVVGHTWTHQGVRVLKLPKEEREKKVKLRRIVRKDALNGGVAFWFPDV